MADITNPATRSRMMAGIRCKNTQPEMSVRRELHHRGLRFRLHTTGLPGKPDLVLAKHRAVVFVHGCFWHRHGCKNSTTPRTRTEFWEAKLAGNSARDRRIVDELKSDGWRVAIVWECSIRFAQRHPEDTIFDRLAAWLRRGGSSREF